MDFTLPIRIYWEDTDAGGIVFYANYLKFMERARTEWLRSLGVEQHALREATGGMFVVAETQLKYHRPARLDDERQHHELHDPAGLKDQAENGHILGIHDICSRRLIGILIGRMVAPSTQPMRIEASLSSRGASAVVCRKACWRIVIDARPLACRRAVIRS